MLETDLIRQAKEFAQSGAMQLLLDRVEKKFTEVWKSTPAAAAAERETCFHMVMAVHALRAEVELVANSDRVEEWNRRLRGKQV